MKHICMRLNTFNYIILHNPDSVESKKQKIFSLQKSMRWKERVKDLIDILQRLTIMTRLCLFSQVQEVALLFPSASISLMFLITLTRSNFQQNHACFKLVTKKQEQCLCACFYLFIAEFE